MDGLVIKQLRDLQATMISSQETSTLLPCIVNLRCASFGLRRIKKVLASALTRLATLRHNIFVRECVHGERVLAQPMTSE